MRDILAVSTVTNDDEIAVGGENYYTLIMEEEYDDSWQISANEGDLVFFRMVTYGYGETIKWDDLQAEKEKLDEWRREMSEKFSCKYRIEVTANHW